MPYKARASAQADYLIGRRIAKLREKRGLSQTVLGQAVGVTFQQIQKYEQGRNRISAANLLLVANVLDVSCDDLLKDASALTADTASKLSYYDAMAVEMALVFSNITDDAFKSNILSMVKSAALLHKQSRKDTPEMINADQTMAMISDVRSLIENNASY